MILTYHHIGNGEDENWVSVEGFCHQMRELKLWRYKVVFLNEYNQNNPNQVVITFDDGYASIKNAFPILKKYKYPFEVFIVGNYFGTDGYICKDNVSELIANGGRLQWHTKTHRKLTELNRNELVSELAIPQHLSCLDENGFYAFAYPYWESNKSVQNAVKVAGFICARSGNGFACGLEANSRYLLDSIKVKESFDMDKIVKFIELSLPTFPCNLRCHYCYVGQWSASDGRDSVPEFKFSPQDIAKAFSKKQLGGTCLINFCANGETLILPQNVEYIKAILECGHFVMVVSNMTITNAIDNLLSLPSEWRQRLFFKCSFHWQELKRLNLLKTFTDNVNRAWESGVSIVIEIAPSDEQETYIEQIKKYSLQYFGALPHVTVSRDEHKPGFEILTKHSRVEYQKIWGQFDSEFFKFKMSMFGRKITEFCYAGEWSYFVDIASGNVKPCLIDKNIGNIRGQVSQNPVGNNCCLAHCYNAQVWVGLGLVPDIICSNYAQMRDRVRQDGSHWLYPRIAAVCSQKLYDNNGNHYDNKATLIKSIGSHLKAKIASILGKNG